MHFYKMHGAGNDYIYLNGFDQSLPEHLSQLAQDMSHRHFGIGADGLVAILPSDMADAEMRMFNADGSEAEMCGNALRCVAWFLRNRGLCDSDEMIISTGRGLLRATMLSQHASGGSVRVDMGVPILAADGVPTTLSPGICINTPLTVNGTTRPVTCVSMGNPHCVLFCESTAAAPVGTLGPLIETHSAFPNQTNVGFAEVVNRSEMKLRVWERGSGETMACGTGACAAVVAAILTKQCDRSVNVVMPGGQLQIEWPADAAVRMTGPVKEVFTGEWPT